MAEFKGVTKQQHEALTKAAAMYERITGERLDTGIDSIPVQTETGEDAEAKAQRDAEELEKQAEVTRKREEAQQAERQLAVGGPLGQGAEPIKSPLAARNAELAGAKQEPEGVDRDVMRASSASKKK